MMPHITSQISLSARTIGAMALLVVVGCHSCDPAFGPACADISPGAIPQPLGSHVCQWQTAQAE